MTLLSNILQVVRSVPQVIKYLPPEYKTYEYFLARVEGLVRGVYSGNVGGDFVDILASLIRGQVADAYSQAWADEGYDPPLPDYLNASMEAFITAQTNFDWIYQYYTDIIDARVDKTPIAPLLSRAGMWAGQWDTAYREALLAIQLESGGNFEWQKGQTEKGCSTCAALDGFVMTAKEWQALDLHPRGYPNSKLECEGGGPANNCDCTLSPTDKRRSPNAYGRIEAILMGI